MGFSDTEWWAETLSASRYQGERFLHQPQELDIWSILVDMVFLNPDIYGIQVRALDHPDNVSKEWHAGVEFQLPQIQF